MKILEVKSNARKRAFEVRTRKGVLPFPWARLRLQPTPSNRVARVYVDPELGNEGFTYELEDGSEDSLHLDAVLDYNADPDLLRRLLLHRLTLEARNLVEESGLGKREMIRRLNTSASQFYRLLDPGNTRKSIGQLLSLLSVLGCHVDVVVRPFRAEDDRPRSAS